MAQVPMDIISGPLGNNGGDFWSFRPVNKINQIIISYGTGNDPIAITLSSTKSDGSKDTITVGGTGPGTITRTDTVNIDGAGEYLTGISGTLVTYLRSIKFTTNLREYGPYGPDVGTSFSLGNVVGTEVVGFLGRSGFYIDAIGTYTKSR